MLLVYIGHRITSDTKSDRDIKIRGVKIPRCASTIVHFLCLK